MQLPCHQTRGDSVLANPERYDVVYNGCAHAEASMLDMFLGQIVYEAAEEGGIEAEVVSPDTVTIQGDPEAALTQIRRLECFTNYIGNLVIRRRFEDLSALFWSRENERNTPQALADTYAELERKYGCFEIFHGVKVLSIYAGDGRGRSRRHLDEMKTPTGVKPEQRVGTSGFGLASSITPNGIPRWEVSVYLEVVETVMGEFRITKIEWRYTY
ncbi:hypothetical protein [Denitromonas iodatirespirans]|uniref:Uncharacterized protein n=1 Tax=Denitromonas iodatirespirans TaxID=2795389 RepID=A0A944HA80_DENI1|nr:hypothetical protein [Denitromonas iodatirespirans]MBT0964268.1 hypothetical protein [Denitromonas iodatirespirans]